MRVISYNLRKNKALAELEPLVENHSPHLLCLQEANVGELPKNIGNLRLIHSTENNRLGLAMYAKKRRFEVLRAETFKLKSSVHDKLLSPASERLLGVHFFDHKKNQAFVAASFHAAPLTALNSLRRHQIESAHNLLKELGDGASSLMVGDFNYPVFQSFLDSKVRLNGFDMTISDKRTYTRYKVFRGHFDFATSYGLNIGKITTLDRGESDHLPILVQAKFLNSYLPRENQKISA